MDGPPIRVFRYGLKSANDCPKRDPKCWTLIAMVGDNEHVIHSVPSNPKWTRRWQWRYWVTGQQVLSNTFYLTIKGNHGTMDTQLGQLQFFGTSKAPIHETSGHDNLLIPYSRLAVYCAARSRAGEEAKYLLEEARNASSKHGTSKWHTGTCGPVTLIIKVNESMNDNLFNLKSHSML